MTKQTQAFARWFLIGILALGISAQFVATAQTITMTTAKQIGEKIKLKIFAEGDISIDGASGTFTNGTDVEYIITKQTITIKGKVTEFYAGFNRLTALDVSKNADLIKLGCYYNQLTSLDVSKNIALTKLNCYKNKLTTLDVSQSTALTYLGCSSNQLTTLDISQNTALTELLCSVNQLTSLDVSKNTALSKLHCYRNKFTSLDLSTNIALTDLSCFRNQVTSLDVSKNTALTSLNCSSNQLTKLDISKNTALTDLSCFRNQLTSLDVSRNTALTGLECHSNRIKDEEMTSLVNSLPSLSASKMGEFIVIDTKDTNEGNICTTADVAIAKGKAWKVYDYNGSFSNKKEYTGSQVSASVINSSSVRIYPNPAKDFVQIQGAPAAAIVRLYGLDGRLVLIANADTDGAIRLNVSALAAGEYLLVIGSERRKLIIE